MQLKTIIIIILKLGKTHDLPFTSDGGTSDSAKPQFADPAVQDILTRLTGLDLQKVFRPMKQELNPPAYKLMTNEQLQKVISCTVIAAYSIMENNLSVLLWDVATW